MFFEPVTIVAQHRATVTSTEMPSGGSKCSPTSGENCSRKQLTIFSDAWIHKVLCLHHLRCLPLFCILWASVIRKTMVVRIFFELLRRLEVVESLEGLAQPLIHLVRAENL